MSAQQLAEEIESIISLSVDSFAAEVEALQGTIYNRLVTLLKDLELDGDGYIKQSAFNRRILYDAENMVHELLPGEDFTRMVSNSITAIADIDAANEAYFSSMSGKFSSNKNYFRSLQTQTISQIESTLLQDGLTAAIKNPLVNILNQNINTGGQFSGFLQQVRDFIQGNDDLDGRLLSYSRTYLSDTLFNYSRAFQQAVTADLKLEYYAYTGGAIDKTREFCLERLGRFFHQKEVESWAELDWQGKRPDTTKSSIFIYCGGYNCRHSLIPVDKSIVPKEDQK